MKRHILILFALSFLSTGCIYKFSAELGEAEKRAVIEGDLMIGQVSKVGLSYVTSVTSLENLLPAKPATVWLIGEDGSRYDAVVSETKGFYDIDLTKASNSTRYQLHVLDNDTGHEYSTDWIAVNKAAVIDELTHNLMGSKVAIGISLHANGQKYFRWNYDEIWEYAADYFASVKYIPRNELPRSEQSLNPYGVVEPLPESENIYYCWNSRQSSEILLFTTKEQSDDRFVDLEFHTIPISDLRVSLLYYIKVYVSTLSEDAYKYWENIRTNSDYNGSLFAPNPSEMHGNISCKEHPEESVIGFINISEMSVAEIYVDNNKTHYYDTRGRYNTVPEACESSELWPNLYRTGSLPVEEIIDAPGTYTWVSKYCVDCRLMGGNKNKPSFWPNKHQ